MAGVMSGVMHAPLMGSFLSAELTGGFDLFLPLMIVSTLSYGTIRIFEPYSIYTRRLAIKGELITHHKDKAVLTLLKMDSVIEKDLQIVHPDMTLGDMVKVISKSERNIFPVTDNNNRFLGIVLLNDIRNIMFQPRLYNRLQVQQFMISPPGKIEIGMTMEQVMNLFDDTNAWNLPVVENGYYIGFVSKSKSSILTGKCFATTRMINKILLAVDTYLLKIWQNRLGTTRQTETDTAIVSAIKKRNCHYEKRRYQNRLHGNSGLCRCFTKSIG
jgi:Chloride channel protein EriC